MGLQDPEAMVSLQPFEAALMLFAGGCNPPSQLPTLGAPRAGWAGGKGAGRETEA